MKNESAPNEKSITGEHFFVWRRFVFVYAFLAETPENSLFPAFKHLETYKAEEHTNKKAR